MEEERANLLPVSSGEFGDSGRLINWMRAWHGTANAMGFALCGCLAWSIVERTVFDPAVVVMCRRTSSGNRSCH